MRTNNKIKSCTISKQNSQTKCKVNCSQGVGNEQKESYFKRGENKQKNWVVNEIRTLCPYTMFLENQRKQFVITTAGENTGSTLMNGVRQIKM